ncbi:UNVERIFIED_CONTAM: GRAS family protein RAM1 [Sesamum radiatum]|uniref:GRAS family protein RAM1 n=1 Tax=Sesamum radiatum TaxID=300843 RepID=A0AAW2VIE4_SESRA
MAYSFLPQDSYNDRRNFLSGLPVFEDAAGAIWFPSLYDESGDFKRLKRTVSLSEVTDCNSGSISSNGSISRTSSTSSLSSVPRLQFRDHIWTYTQRYLAAEAVEEAAAAIVGAEEGLADRLALVQPLGTVGYIAPKMNIMDIASEKKEEALRLVYEICPHIQFGHFVANSSILEAFEGESLVHVVDLGMTLGLPHGQQWHSLIRSLAKRPGPSPRLRITAIGLCIDKFRVIGDELETYAIELGLNLEFSVVESNLENLKPEDIKVVPGEVLVVNSILQLHCVVKESRGALNSVLQIIHELSPKVLVLVEQDSSHNGPFFLGRFMEALHYYSAIFDSLDAMLPKYDTRRAKMEQFYFAEEIKNIVSCEGPARVERHERVDQWRRRMSRAGFQPVPLKMLAQAKQWLSSISACEGYTIVEEKGCLVLGWKSKPIVAASCWKC